MEFQDLSTDCLVQLVREGQAASFDAIVKRYQMDVLNRVHLLLLDRITSEDVVQEVFFRAFKHLQQYRLGTSFRNWLMGITQNTVLQELRRSRRYTGRLARYAEMVEHRLEELTPEEEGERGKELLDCIGRLESFAARTVRARYTQSQSIEEIAETTGRTLGAVRTLLYRARAQLRTCLERKGTWAMARPHRLKSPAAAQAATCDD